VVWERHRWSIFDFKMSKGWAAMALGFCLGYAMLCETRKLEKQKSKNLGAFSEYTIFKSLAIVRWY
jgi:hypothetical protein